MSYCVALDLDETIISSTSLLPPSEHFLKIKIPSIRRYIFIQLRPGLKEFIKEMIKNGIEVFIFTSQPKKVANPIIDTLALNIFPSSSSTFNDKLVEKDHEKSSINTISSSYIPQNHRFFREDCIIENGYYVKDLNLICNQKKDKYCPINNIFLVDDMQGNAQRQPQNLIKIKPWFGNDEEDNELLDYVLPTILNKINSNIKVNCIDSDLPTPSLSITNGIGNKKVEQTFCNEMSVV